MTPPPETRTMPGAIARFGRYAVFMHEGHPHAYEIPTLGSASNPYQECKHLGAVASLPACYLRVKNLAECCRLAVEEIRAREGLVAR